MMSYEEVIQFGMKHYNRGGDSVVECLSRKDYEQEIAEGYVFNEKNLLERFHVCYNVWHEMQALANW